MKKTILTLMLMLASAVAINAQSLIGTWCTVLPIEDQDAQMILEFEDNGACTMGILMSQDMSDNSMKMVVNAALGVPGTYTLNGKKLNFTFDKDNSEVEVDYEVSGVDPHAKQFIDSLMKPELEKMKPELKKELMASIPDLGEMKIVSLTKESLELADEEGTVVTFLPFDE